MSGRLRFNNRACMSKPYRIWLLLTNKSDDFRLISVTLWNYTAPIVACSRFSDSREDAKVRGTQKKGRGGGRSQSPRTRLSRSMEQATPILVDRHISDRSLCHSLAQWRSSCSYYYRIAPHISMSNSFVYFSNPRGFYSVFSDFPLFSSAKNCTNSNSI